MYTSSMIIQLQFPIEQRLKKKKKIPKKYSTLYNIQCYIPFGKTLGKLEIEESWEYYILCSFLCVQHIRGAVFVAESSCADIGTEINQRVYTNKGISPPSPITGRWNAETKSNLDIVNARIINLPISFENIRSLPVS